MGNISDKENTYSFWGHYVKGQGHRQLLWVFFTFLFLMLHCAAISGILFCRELSNLVRMFVWVRFWSGSNMGHLGSVCPHFLCAAITGILFYRELSNFVRMFLWTRSFVNLFFFFFFFYFFFQVFCYMMRCLESCLATAHMKYLICSLVRFCAECYKDSQLPKAYLVIF